jgi:hypothetical protein
MKHALVMVLLLGMTSHASADRRDAWWGAVLGSSVMMIGGGAYILYDGRAEVRDASDQLCAGGIAQPSCTAAPVVTLTQSDIDRINEQGDRGVSQAWLGAGVIGVGLVLSTVAVVKLASKPKRDAAVVVAPAVSTTGAGASLMLRW